jgi:dTDP-4-dehydrorhamnose reductase
LTTRVLLLGAGGMLGHRLALELARAPDLEVHCTLRRPIADDFVAAGVQYHAGVDLSDGSEPLRALLDGLAPDVVINAVGAVKQRDLAAAPDRTFFLNGVLPHLLCLLNPNRTARVVHVSTDCVFSGGRGGYTESDVPDAEDLYGRSKAIGELAYGRHVTLRTSLIGFEVATHLSLLSWFFRQPTGSRLRGYSHAIFSGLPTATFSRLVVHLVRAGTPPPGLYHVASSPISKYDLLCRINDAFRLGHEIESDGSVRLDRSLDDSRFRRLTGLARPGWDDLIADLQHDYVTWPYEAVYHALRDQGAKVGPTR